MTEAATDATDGEGSGDREAPPAQRISAVIIQTYKAKFGKGPENIRVHLTGDTVMALLRGGFSVVEESLRAAGQAEAVRDQRRVFGDMVAPALAEAITEVIDREVVAVLADTSQDPDLCVIVLVLAPRD
ncbi:Na-translocating system protein MpsC family protein [Patulibacter sp.]|uniref:Na-translocating system protein MpsC family protein n=1 Tax=Patulibacter sp. TaxID=1912859 RepID=UPI002723BB5C|nr:Na-translocating system protein MpsC family protein [Patulibacter sp.]MDO9407470.1 Na-translocating system protein MpsC family protein [Patulibacter sp.]